MRQARGKRFIQFVADISHQLRILSKNLDELSSTRDFQPRELVSFVQGMADGLEIEDAIREAVGRDRSKVIRPYSHGSSKYLRLCDEWTSIRTQIDRLAFDISFSINAVKRSVFWMSPPGLTLATVDCIGDKVRLEKTRESVKSEARRLLDHADILRSQKERLEMILIEKEQKN